MRKILLAALLFLSLSWMIDALEEDHLKESDINRIMQQIFSEHVDKKKLTDPILHEALIVYIDQFDPHRMYLLESEVAPFFDLPADQLDAAIEQYKKGDFSLFEKLNQVIQKAILRARTIRASLEQTIKNSTFSPSPDVEQRPLAKQEMIPFAQNLDTLKERILENLGTYLQEQKSRLGQTPKRADLDGL